MDKLKEYVKRPDKFWFFYHRGFSFDKYANDPSSGGEVVRLDAVEMV